MRGVSTRLALHVGNVPFEDERVSYKSVHDPGETWLTMKKTMPFRQMPVMTINDIVEKKFPEMLSDLDKVLEKHSAGKWSVGNTLTVADLCVYVLIGLIKSDLWNGIPTNMADKYTCAHRVYEAVRTHPKVAEWELAHKK
ncbi:hypothetical protein BASA50_007377 [Batrachochytrium salamandrivorans]|uniref:GST C-terminal domain-containing protein n=1 Tax=Batrachochytrium salamandrivorans TaxID=1357716 RepID=A0ABQ8F796_9FUNG|nr:hypothetical protein BASA50_007377 [Batrachochytrium salamandrivorans]